MLHTLILFSLDKITKTFNSCVFIHVIHIFVILPWHHGWYQKSIGTNSNQILHTGPLIQKLPSAYFIVQSVDRQFNCCEKLPVAAGAGNDI